MFHLITREFLRPFVTIVLILTLPVSLFAQIQDASYRPAIHEPFATHPVKRQSSSSGLRVSAQPRGRKTILNLATTTTTARANTPPVENLTPAYLSGESKVVVQGNQNPLIRLGMAQNGVTMIELPASDRFFAIHTGNSDLVTVEKSPTMTSDHYLVLRAGSGFVTPPPVRKFKGKDGRLVTTPRRELPVTSIIVQMRSGMALTFMIYPVQYLAQQAHRCVVSYNRTEVVAARQAAGLAVNLREDDQPTAPATATKAVNSVAALRAEEVQHPPSSAAVGVVTANNSLAAPVLTVPASLVKLPEEAPPLSLPQQQTLTTRPTKIDRSQAIVVEVVSQNKRSVFLSKSNAEVDADAAAQAGLTSATKEPKRFKHWTASVHGLSVSSLPVIDLNDRLRMVVLGVRNTLSGPVRLVPGHPDLFIETLTGDSNSGGGKPVEIERVRKVTSLSTTANRVIPSGSIVFFAVVFEAPILGAKQHLRLAVAQTDAADEPAGTDMTAKTR